MTTRGHHRFVVAAIVVATTGAGIVRAADFFTELGLTEQQTRQFFRDSLTSGIFAYSSAPAQAFKALSPAVRATMVAEAVKWAQAYVASAAFGAAYAQARDAAKPTPPEVTGSADDAVKQQQADQQKQLDDMKKVVASMPADQRAAMEQVINQMAASMEQSTKNPALQQMMKQGIEADRAKAQGRYQEDLTRWQDDYPADPSALVARRLRAFLAASAAVDFAAKLTSAKRFVDEQYEGKPREWKFCYRAGKEAVTAARTAAAAWLSALERK